MRKGASLKLANAVTSAYRRIWVFEICVMSLSDGRLMKVWRLITSPRFTLAWHFCGSMWVPEASGFGFCFKQTWTLCCYGTSEFQGLDRLVATHCHVQVMVSMPVAGLALSASRAGN